MFCSNNIKNILCILSLLFRHCCIFVLFTINLLFSRLWNIYTHEDFYPRKFLTLAYISQRTRESFKHQLLDMAQLGIKNWASDSPGNSWLLTNSNWQSPPYHVVKYCICSVQIILSPSNMFQNYYIAYLWITYKSKQWHECPLYQPPILEQTPTLKRRRWSKQPCAFPRTWW